MFTKQHYKAIAEIVKFGVHEEENAKGCGIAIKMARRLADFFAADDERFNRENFANACKPNSLDFIEATGQTESEYFNL